MTVDRRTWLKAAAISTGAGLTGGGAVQAATKSKGPATVSPSTITVVSRGGGKYNYGPALETLRRYIALHLKDYGLPGMTFCVADRDGFKAVINAGWSDVDTHTPVGPDHLFQIGSISKSFAALCVLRAAEAGKLSLDDAIADHVPGVPLPSQKITIRQILTHASGLPDDAPFFPRGGDEHLWTGYTPGERFSYSNTGYALLGLMLERIHNKPYAEVVRTEAINPVGMTGAKGSIRDGAKAAYATGYWPYYEDKPFVQRDRLGVAYFNDFVEASGSVAATADQMTHYVRYLIDAGVGKGAPLLSDAGAKAFTTPVIDAPVFGPKAHYALGLGVVPINGRQLLHHTGGMMAFSSSIHVDPEGGVGAFASTNARIGSYRPRDVTAYACELMYAVREGKTAPAAPPIHYDDRIEKAADYAGRYETAGGEAFTLHAEGAKLVLIYDRTGEATALHSQGDDVFIAPASRFEGLPLTFERKDGKPVLAWWGDARFVKAPAKGAPTSTPPALAALAGFYVNNDPWVGNFQVVARENGLWLDGVEPLIPLPDGSYRVGKEAWGCERVRFEALLDGRPQRMIFSGAELTRIAVET